MAIQIDSTRFGSLEVPEEELIEFPLGLIGIEGSRYVFVDPKPGSAFRWLHSVEDPAFALPVVNPSAVMSSFTLSVGAEERQRVGLDDLADAGVYVTVRATPDPTEATINLRAPLVIWRGRGHQVINTAPGASLRAPLIAAS
ncbi:MAG TPA: flagellar assembly protein FliW [Solirubrobacteraceae bacterium]|jgi:flagellar assembly factor FliW